MLTPHPGAMRLLPLSLLLAGWLLAGPARGQAAARPPGPGGAALAPGPAASYWLDRDNTPWLRELGEVCRQQGQVAEAHRYFERSIAVSRQVPNQPYVLTVRLTREGQCLCLHVLDDGTPLSSPAAPAGRPAGHGLRNMRQRAEAVGGTLRLEAGPAGFGVVACLPVRGQ